MEVETVPGKEVNGGDGVVKEKIENAEERKRVHY